MVPLGNRRVTGYVLGLLPEEDVGYRLREVLEVLDPEPLFPANLIPFFRWVARYYHYPLGEVIKTALPGGLAPRGGRQLCLTEHGQLELVSILENTEILPPKWLAPLLEKGSRDGGLSKDMGRKELAQTHRILAGTGVG